MDLMARYTDKHFDLAIVDPPYGGNDAINPVSSDKVKKAKRKSYKEFKNEKPGEQYFKELFRVSKNQIIWGGNFFGLSGGYICWNKNGTVFGEAELAYNSFSKSVRVFEYTWNGMIQENMKNKEIRIHPTQKPVALYEWILSKYAKDGDIILDTHVGSASSLIACENLGFEYVACEKDPDYYQESLKRLRQHTAQKKLFSTQLKKNETEKELFNG